MPGQVARLEGVHTVSVLSIVQVSVVPTCSSVDSETNASFNTSCYEVRCDQHILTTFIIPDVLLITSFAYGLYIFRWIQTEQLATLTEAVSPDSSLFLRIAALQPC